jgi:hypothetical protein
MPRKAISDAIEAALAGAKVDHTQPPDEQVSFSPAQLATVVNLFRRPGTRDETLETARTTFKAAVNALDMDRSKAGLMLIERLEAQKDVTYGEDRDGTRHSSSYAVLCPRTGGCGTECGAQRRTGARDSESHGATASGCCHGLGALIAWEWPSVMARTRKKPPKTTSPTSGSPNSWGRLLHDAQASQYEALTPWELEDELRMALLTCGCRRGDGPLHLQRPQGPGVHRAASLQ